MGIRAGECGGACGEEMKERPKLAGQPPELEGMARRRCGLRAQENA